MANTSMVQVKRGEEVDEATARQLSEFQRRFLDEHRKVLRESGLPPRCTLFGQPHDSIVTMDQANVTILASKGTATDTSSTDIYRDFSSRGTVSSQELIRSAAGELGWEGVVSVQFPRILLDAPEEIQRAEFTRVAQQVVAEIRRRQQLASTLGITESLEYLANARERFEAGGSTGFSDCKANCRNALVSLLGGLTGTENVRKAVKTLHKEGLLGKRETEVVETLEAFVKKLHDQASKTGAHPPMATEEDALLTLRLTEAVAQYLVGLAAKAKGL